MRADEVEAVAEWLRSEVGVPFVVVGGSAIERSVAVGTKDVDVLISGDDWPSVDEALEGRADAPPLEPMSGTIRGTIVTIGRGSIELEFLSGEPFCGTRGPGEFTRYVTEKGSQKHGETRYATPEVVFYMRLSTDDWKAYVPSIERDLHAGVNPAALDGVVTIADHFGVGSRIRERVESARKMLRLFEDR